MFYHRLSNDNTLGQSNLAGRSLMFFFFRLTQICKSNPPLVYSRYYLIQDSHFMQKLGLPGISIIHISVGMPFLIYTFLVSQLHPVSLLYTNKLIFTFENLRNLHLIVYRVFSS
jgi:hypothetical protein